MSFRCSSKLFLASFGCLRGAAFRFYANCCFELFIISSTLSTASVRSRFAPNNFQMFQQAFFPAFSKKSLFHAKTECCIKLLRIPFILTTASVAASRFVLNAFQMIQKAFQHLFFLGLFVFTNKSEGFVLTATAIFNFS